MSVYLVTSADGRYWERIVPYLDSLNHFLNHGDIEPIIYAINSRPPDYIRDHWYGSIVYMSHADNFGTSESTSIEHGSFLRFLPEAAGPDALIIYTNADLRMQRAIGWRELGRMKQLGMNEFMAGYNAGPDDTLADEALRLRPLAGYEEIDANFPDFESVPCCNMGVFVARRQAYERIYREYMKRWARVNTTFSHFARQQWLVNYAAYAAGLAHVELDPSIHLHFHYGAPDGVEQDDGGTLYYHGVPAVWTHKHERVATTA